MLLFLTAYQLPIYFKWHIKSLFIFNGISTAYLFLPAYQCFIFNGISTAYLFLTAYQCFYF